MKKVFKFLVGVTACAALIFAGCGKESYNFYTNVPSGGYTALDDTFSLGKEIGGYTRPTDGGEFVAPEGYTAKARSFYHMNTEAQLIISDDFSDEGRVQKFESFSAEVEKTLSGISKAISSTDDASDISAFNLAAAGETIKISKITYEVLDFALGVYEFTDGYYNPALYYNILSYGFGGAESYPHSKEELPEETVIEKYTALASHFGEIKLNETDGEYFVTKPVCTVTVDGKALPLKLDLGGIGKGYTVDRIEELFDGYGYKYGLFNFGASSLLIKSNAREGNYRLALINPRSPARDAYIEIPLRNQKLSTSGDYEQYYSIDGVRYCHIIDPTTGAPVQTGIMSVTVIGGSAAEADALTTAIMCMGKDRAIKFIEEKLTDKRVVFTVE